MFYPLLNKVRVTRDQGFRYQSFPIIGFCAHTAPPDRPESPEMDILCSFPSPLRARVYISRGQVGVQAPSTLNEMSRHMGSPK